MNGVVSGVVAAVGTLLALWSAVWAVRGLAPTALQNRLSLAYQVVLTVLAVVGLVALTARVPGDLAFYLGYLVVAVLVQPVLLIAVPAESPGGKSWVLALALFAAAVVVLRMQATWDVR